MKYFYCDACAIIDLFKRNELIALSRFKGIFHISDLHLESEILYPKDIKDATKKSLVVDITTIEMLESCVPIMQKHKRLSRWDVLALVFCIEKGYCLVTNDIDLQKACDDYDVLFVNLDYIEEVYIKGGGGDETVKD